MKNTLNLKQLGTAITAIFALMLLVMGVCVAATGLNTTNNASDLHISQKGNLGFIGNAKSCVVVTFANNKTYAPEKAVKRDIAAKQFNWIARTSEQQAGCDALKQDAAPVKIWKVAVNPRYPTKTTRPTKNIVVVGAIKMLGIATKIRAKIGLICGEKIKGINKRYEYREVKISGGNYAAVCE